MVKAIMSGIFAGDSSDVNWPWRFIVSGDGLSGRSRPDTTVGSGRRLALLPAVG